MQSVWGQGETPSLGWMIQRQGLAVALNSPLRLLAPFFLRELPQRRQHCVCLRHSESEGVAWTTDPFTCSIHGSFDDLRSVEGS
jgi:hypothetical protein